MNTDNIDIFTASALGDIGIISDAIARGEAVSNKNREGWTLLMYATYIGHADIVDLLINAGISKRCTNNSKQNALMLAAAKGNLKILHNVYEVDILEEIDSKGWTALFYSIHFGQVRAANFLLSQGANVNVMAQGKSLLMLAVTNGKQDCVELLLKFGANKYLLSNDGSTARDLANANYHFQIITLLDATQDQNDLPTLLHNINLDKYWPVFRALDINLKQFINLTEDDLKMIGINLLGPRRKMSMTIAEIKRQRKMNQTEDRTVTMEDNVFY